MKIFILTVLIALLMNMPAFSQSGAIEGKVEYQRGDKRAAIIELPFPPELVEGALKESLAKKGVKEEKLKGMQVFKGARLTPTDGEIVDLYFKIDKKSKKEDNTSVVYLVLGRPNENVALRTADDAYRMQDAKAFLSGLTPVLEAYKLEQEIAMKEDEIRKAEKKFNNLADDQKNLEKKIRDLEEKVAQNKREQEAANAEIVKQRTLRDALLAKRIVAN